MADGAFALRLREHLRDLAARDRTLRDVEDFKRRTGAKVARAFDRRVAIRDGDYGTEDTIREMARLAVDGSRDLVVRLMAIQIIGEAAGREGVKGRDHEGIARRVFHWMQDGGSGERSGVKFVNDPWRTETVQAPWITLCVSGAGDCNSAHATTNCALLLSVGIPCFFRTVKVDPGRPNLFSHVYAVANIRGRPLALDSSVAFSTPGSEPQAVYGSRDWPLDIYVQDDYVGSAA